MLTADEESRRRRQRGVIWRRGRAAAAAIALASQLALTVAARGGDTPPSAARPAPPPADIFAELAAIIDPVLSPDGRMVAARGYSDGKPRLVVFSTADPAGSMHRYDIADGEVVSISWAGPHRVLATTRLHGFISATRLPILRLLAIDVVTGGVTTIDRRGQGLFGGNVLYADPSGGWALVASQDSAFETPSVKRIDLLTGKEVEVERAREGVWEWYADGQGVVRAGVAYGDDRWTIWYRDTPDAPLKATRAKVGRDEEGVIDSLRFLPASNSGVIVTNVRTGRFAAYRYDFATATIGEAIYENPEVDVDSVIVDRTTGNVSGVRYQDDRRRVAWVDPVMRDIQTKLDRALPAAENRILGTSADDNFVLIWSGGASDPGKYYFYDRASKQMAAIAQRFRKVSDIPLAPVKPVHYAARDGLSLPGYLTLPVGRDAHDLPLIVLPHGGPFMRDDWDYDPIVQFLASRGYAVLQPEFRGSTGYGRDFVEKGSGEWGRKMQDDVDDGVAWLAKAGVADPQRVCIMGGSYGGYAALWGAIRNPEIYRCAISLAGVTDLRAQLDYDRRSFSAPRYFRKWRTKISGGAEFDLDSVSPLKQASRLSVPVLIAHGEKDERVLPDQGHAMVDALKRRKADVDSVFYKEDGHGLDKPQDMADFLKRVDAFLARHNPA